MLHVNAGEFWVCPVSGRVGDTPIESGFFESGKHVVNMYDSTPRAPRSLADRPKRPHASDDDDGAPSMPAKAKRRKTDTAAPKTETKVLQINSQIREAIEQIVSPRPKPSTDGIRGGVGSKVRDACLACTSSLKKHRASGAGSTQRINLTNLLCEVLASLERTRGFEGASDEKYMNHRGGNDSETALISRISNICCRMYHRQLTDGTSKGLARIPVRVFVLCALTILKDGILDANGNAVVEPMFELDGRVPTMKTAQRIYDLDITKVTRMRRLLKECIIASGGI